MEENKKTLTPQEQRDEQMISESFQRLLDTYLSSGHRGKKDIIIKAFNFAKQAHKGVRRLSGEPYILHPIAVAQIVCQEIGLGSMLKKIRIIPTRISVIFSVPKWPIS